MIRARIKVSSGGLAHLPVRAEAAVRAGLTEGAGVAAEVAQANASIDLELELIPPRGTPDAFVAGIESRKRGSVSGVRLAPIFDGGSLGGRSKDLATDRDRRESWNVTSPAGNEYTAHRDPEVLTDPSKGVTGENFFTKARSAGRKAMLATIREQI